LSVTWNASSAIGALTVSPKRSRSFCITAAAESVEASVTTNALPKSYCAT
jgi:hypothetical protein